MRLKIRPKISKAGRTSQPTRIKSPAKIVKISAKIPRKIRKILKTAPKIREIKLEKKTSKYFPRSNPRG